MANYKLKSDTLNEYAIRFSDIVKRTWVFHFDGKTREIPAGSVKLHEVDGIMCAKREDVKGLAQG